MLKNLRLRILSYFVIAYMLLAFGWWSILLFKMNEDAFLAKTEYLRLAKIAERKIKSDLDLIRLPEYIQLEKGYRRQQWMILGEAIVFVISLVIGVWLINRGYNKEMMAAQQRRNFLLSITHELKSPISSIRLVLQTLLKRDLTKPQKEMLSNNALNDTERLNELVNNLLLAARVENAYQPAFEEIYLDSVLNEIIDRLKNKYPQTEFQLSIKGKIPMIQADRMGMTSVALNLLENAVKYSTQPRLIEAHLIETNDNIYLTIGDQGIGITDKEKKQIFDQFYRVGNEDTRKTKGTGLGLYIVKEIVKAHNGKITVKDNKPKGSIFEVLLPINQLA